MFLKRRFDHHCLGHGVRQGVQPLPEKQPFSNTITDFACAEEHQFLPATKKQRSFMIQHGFLYWEAHFESCRAKKVTGLLDSC